MKHIVTTNLKGKINSFSKTRLEKYNKCPYWAWRDLRSTKKNDSSRQLEVGILAHEIAAKKLADFAGIKRVIDDIKTLERFSLEVIYEVEKEIFKHTSFEHLYNGMQIIGIEDSISFDLPEIAENFRFNGRFDAISLMEINKQKFIVVDDFKTGFQISTTVDTEALIYSFAAYKHYGLPVIFRRIGLRTGKVWSHEFSINTLLNFTQNILFKVKHWKEEMEGDLIPEYTPGSHCVYCQFLSSCQGRKDISNLNRKYKAAIWAKQYAKSLETEVKAAAVEVLSHAETPAVGEDLVVLPFLGNKYGAVAKTSESYQLKGRKISKSDLIKLLIQTGDIENFIECLDIKIDSDLAKKLNEEYKIAVKKVVKTTVSLIEKKEEESE